MMTTMMTTTAFYNGAITNIDDCTPLDQNLDAIGLYCGNESSTTEVVGHQAVQNSGAWLSAPLFLGSGSEWGSGDTRNHRNNDRSGNLSLVAVLYIKFLVKPSSPL